MSFSIRQAPPQQYRRQPIDLLDSIEFSNFDPVVLGATAATVWDENPLASLMRMDEIAEAQYGRPQEWHGNAPSSVPAEAPDSPLLTIDQANERGEEWGLSFEVPMRERAVDIMIERARRRRHRHEILALRRGGPVATGMDLVLGLGVSVLDPINIGVSFIPVVGQSRWAAWAARMGATRARLAKGAIEGAVGATVVEPVVLAAARLEQNNDYTMANSLMNIAFGTILGGGLHVGFGAIGDRLAAARPETRQVALSGAVAQTAEGRPVNVDAVVKADERVIDPAAREIDRLAEALDDAEVNGLRAQTEVRRAEAEATTARAMEAQARRTEAEAEAEVAARDRDVSVRRAVDAFEGREGAAIEGFLDEATGQRLTAIENELGLDATPAGRRAELEAERQGIIDSIPESERRLAAGRATQEAKALDAATERARGRAANAKADEARAKAELREAHEALLKADAEYRAAVEAKVDPREFVAARKAEQHQNLKNAEARLNKQAQEDPELDYVKEYEQELDALARFNEEKPADDLSLDEIEGQIDELAEHIDDLMARGEIDEGGLNLEGGPRRLDAAEVNEQVSRHRRAARAASTCLLAG